MCLCVCVYAAQTGASRQKPKVFLLFLIRKFTRVILNPKPLLADLALGLKAQCSKLRMRLWIGLLGVTSGARGSLSPKTSEGLYTPETIKGDLNQKP